MALLARLQEAAEGGNRTASLIEILTLQALAHQVQGDVSRALAPLERALTLAQPEEYVRIFVDEGPAMRTLLRHAAAAGIARPYTQALLAAFDTSAPPASTTPQPAAGLVEPLTARETGGRDPAPDRDRHAQPGDRRPSVHQPVHCQAPYRQRIPQAGRRSPHRGRCAGQRGEPAVAAAGVAESHPHLGQRTHRPALSRTLASTHLRRR
jgi:hypothetical protein